MLLHVFSATVPLLHSWADLVRLSDERISETPRVRPRMLIEMRVPGLPIRDWARGCNNRGHTRPQLSATDVMKKTFLSVCIFPRNGHNWAPSQLFLCTHNLDHSNHNYFSISVQMFSTNGPSIFLSLPFTKFEGDTIKIMPAMIQQYLRALLCVKMNLD